MAASSEPARSPQLPLAGTRVLDFGIGGVGVEVTRLLAEYGADVIKVETHTYPDFIRAVLGGLMSPSFASSSRSKRSIGLNVKTPEGLEIARRLVAASDVLVENSGVGVMDELGLGWEAVHAVNPRIVMISSQLLGSEGVWRDWIGYGPSTRAVGGMSHLWNYPDARVPAESVAIHPDHLVGRLGAVAAVAGLVRRERTGSGARAELAQVEAVVGLLGDLFLREALQPGSVGPRGNESEQCAPWGAYPCQGEERWCVINVRSDEDWARLRAAMGEPAWAARPELDTVEGRMRHRDELDAALGAWTRERTDREVVSLLQRHGVPAGMALYATDLLEDPHLVARGFLRPVDQPPLGRITLEGPAFRGTRLAEPVIRPAPLLGEHTRAVCREVLGMGDGEIDRLLAAGVLEEPTPEERAEAAQTARMIADSNATEAAGDEP